MALEHDYPIYLQVHGHPLIENIIVSWSASEGMISQSLSFDSAGGRVKAVIASPNIDQVIIHYTAKISFTIPEWELLTLEESIPYREIVDALKIEPGKWIKPLFIKLSVGQSNQLKANQSQSDHLIVNLSWQSQYLEKLVKVSGRVTPSEPFKTFYLQNPANQDAAAKISGLGTIKNRLVRLPLQDIDLNRESISLLADQDSICVSPR